MNDERGIDNLVEEVLRGIPNWLPKGRMTHRYVSLAHWSKAKRERRKEQLTETEYGKVDLDTGWCEALDDPDAWDGFLR